MPATSSFLGGAPARRRLAAAIAEHGIVEAGQQLPKPYSTPVPVRILPDLDLAEVVRPALGREAVLGAAQLRRPGAADAPRPRRVQRST